MASTIFLSLLMLIVALALRGSIWQLNKKIDKLNKCLNRKLCKDYLNENKDKIIIRDVNCQRIEYHAHIVNRYSDEECLVIDLEEKKNE